MYYDFFWGGALRRFLSHIEVVTFRSQSGALLNKIGNITVLMKCRDMLPSAIAFFFLHSTVLASLLPEHLQHSAS